MISQADRIDGAGSVEGYYAYCSYFKAHKHTINDRNGAMDSVDPETLKHSFDNGKSWYSEEEIDKALTMMSALGRLKDK